MLFSGNIIARNNAISETINSFAPDTATIAIGLAVAISAILATILSKRF